MVKIMVALLLVAQVAGVLVVRILRNDDNLVFAKFIGYCLDNRSLARTGTSGDAYHQHFAIVLIY